MAHWDWGRGHWLDKKKNKNKNFSSFFFKWNLGTYIIFRMSKVKTWSNDAKWDDQIYHRIKACFLPCICIRFSSHSWSALETWWFVIDEPPEILNASIEFMDNRRRLKQCASLLPCLVWIGLYLVLSSCIWYNMRSDSIN